MTETAAALAPEPTPEAPKQPTREEAIAQIRTVQESQFAMADRNERLAQARRGYRVDGKLFILGPSVEPTDAELLEMVPRKRDRLRYITLATNKYGLYATPRPGGRKHPHLNPRQQAIKSEAIRIFRSLFEAKAETLRAVCKDEEMEYKGVPESAIPELAARAGKLATRVVLGKRKAALNRSHQQQAFSRKVNAGLIAGNTGMRNFVNRGGQYGR